jgi:hypothetical protein
MFSSARAVELADEARYRMGRRWASTTIDAKEAREEDYDKLAACAPLPKVVVGAADRPRLPL